MVLVRVGPDHRHHRLLSTLSTFKLDINNFCTKCSQLVSSCFNGTTYTFLKIFQEKLTWQSNPSALDTITQTTKEIRLLSSNGIEVVVVVSSHYREHASDNLNGLSQRADCIDHRTDPRKTTRHRY